MNNLVFSINVVAPVFMIILLGVILKRIKLIDDSFVSVSSSLVFKVSLPALIFSEISGTDFKTIFDIKVILVVYSGIIFALIVSVLLSFVLDMHQDQKGSFIQGSLRGNTVIVGLALVYNVFGDPGVAQASIVVAFIVPLFNIISVIVLTVPMHSGGRGAYRKILINLAKNPLVISIAMAIPFSLFSIPLPGVFTTSLSYLAKMTLPLALIGIGGSLSFTSLKDNLLLSSTASMIKIILVPVFVIFLGIHSGITGSTLGIIFIISAVPTAISSFIMARSMGNDSLVAANIIVMSTLGSVISIGAGIYILKSLGLLGV